MSSILVDFEVLPPESPLDPPSSQVYGDLQGQLGDHNSPLRTGEFGRYAGSASLSPPGGVTEPDHGGPTGSHRSGDFGEAPLPPPPTIGGSAGGPSAADRAFGTGPGGFQASSGAGDHWGSQQAHYDAPAHDSHHAPSSQHGGGGFGNGNWQDGQHGTGHMEGPQALSNTELRSRMAQLEQQLANTAAGHHSGHQQDLPPTHSRDVAGHHSMGPEAYDHQGGNLHERLEAAERNAREAQEAARAERLQRQRLESMLKDREQLLVHAKEMWMKESARASKLADALTNAEDKLADQEKRLSDVSGRYNTASQEVRQLRHLFDGPDGGGFGGGFTGPGAAQFPGHDGSQNGRAGRTAPSLGVPNGDGVGIDATAASRARPMSARSLGSPAPAAHGETPLPPQFEAETNADRFRHLCLASDAILFEDDLIQIGIKSEYRDLECQIGVYFGNKANAALQAFSVQYFTREEHALRLSASSLRQQLEAHDQVVQRVGATCLQPFVEPPMMRVQFLLPDASPRRIQLKFPVVLTKFMRGLELSQDDFFRLWRQHTFTLNEATSVVHLAPRLCSSLANVARSIVFGGSLRLLHGFDPNPDNFVLAGELHEGLRVGGSQDADRGYRDPSRGDYGMGPGEQPPVSAPRSTGGAEHENSVSLVRVEVGSGRFSGKARVVVRAGDHIVAKALCDGIVGQLAMLPANATDAR